MCTKPLSYQTNGERFFVIFFQSMFMFDTTSHFPFNNLMKSSCTARMEIHETIYFQSKKEHLMV